MGHSIEPIPATLDLVQLEKSEARFLKRGEERWMTYRADSDENLVAFFETADEPHAAADEFRYARR